MPIRFRCTHCHGLMAISTRKAGSIVDCATCGEKTLVPLEDISVTERRESEPPEPTQSISHGFSPAVEVAAVTFEQRSDLAEPPLEGPLVDEDQNPSRQPSPRKAGARGRPIGDLDWDEADEEPFVPADVGDEDDGQPLTIRRHKGGDEEMDLTPMVDVTFQLLIFFMVSASFSLQKTIEVPTPDPDQKGATQQVQTMDDLQGTSILVKIDAANTISIDDEPLGDLARLADTLRDKMRREQKTELLLTAHSQSQHRTVIAVIDAANEIGVQKIRMSSQKKTD